MLTSRKNNLRLNLSDLGFGKDFFKYITKSQTVKRKKSIN